MVSTKKHKSRKSCVGITELVSWVLSFGAEAEVLEPQSLRDEIARELRGALARYGG